MSTKSDPRIVDLEARMAVLHSRVMRLERLNGVAGAAPPSPAPRPAPQPEPERMHAQLPPIHRTPPARPAPRPAPRKPIELPDVEELLGGRVLAWVGGIAVVLGLAFFFALAVSRGWIGEGARCLIGSAVAFGLLGAGVWLRELGRRNEAAMAAAATGLAGLFLVIVVATQVYDLVPALAGLGLALAVGSGATLLAVRWDAPVIGGIGTLGSVLAPALAGADAETTTIVLLWLATAAGAAVLVYKRWELLGGALFLASAPQWLPWTIGTAESNQALITLLAFGAAGLAAAIGFELRSKAPIVRHSAAALMAVNSLVISVAGWTTFSLNGDDALAKLWLAGLAVLHASAGAGMYLERRISPALRTLCIALAVVLADVAWGTIAQGPAIGVGWALSAIGFAWAMTRRQMARVERQAAVAGLGGQIAIALIRMLAEDAPLDRLSATASADAIIALASLAAACLVSARLAEDGHETVRRALDTVGLAVVGYLTVFALDGAVLVAALAVQACALAAIARVRDDVVARVGAFAFLAAGGVHALVVEAPPTAFLYGADDMPAMAAALAAVAVASLRIAAVAELPRDWALRIRAGAAATALYGASVAIVSAFQPGAEQASMLLDLGVRQQGQMLVSALWSLTGATTLVIGLSRDSRELRLAGLAVLVASVAKVFVFDLATLTSIYRVASLIALGLLLLAGSYAWQRSRPAPLPDLRNA